MRGFLSAARSAALLVAERAQNPEHLAPGGERTTGALLVGPDGLDELELVAAQLVRVAVPGGAALADAAVLSGAAVDGDRLLAPAPISLPAVALPPVAAGLPFAGVGG